jgi:transposase-like protein
MRERTVRLGRKAEREHNSQWAAIPAISAKIGCARETLRCWVRQFERDRDDGLSLWLKALSARQHVYVVCVALAIKAAPLAWTNVCNG